MCVSMCVCLISMCLSYLSVCLSLCLSVCLSPHFSLFLVSSYLPIPLSPCVSLFLFPLSLSLSISLSVSLHLPLSYIHIIPTPTQIDEELIYLTHNCYSIMFVSAQIFWLAPPSQKNIDRYVEWTLSAKQGDTFLGDLLEQCQRITLLSGYTFIIPSGQ